jgi:hypothetical protein
VRSSTSTRLPFALYTTQYPSRPRRLRDRAFDPLLDLIQGIARIARIDRIDLSDLSDQK